MSRPPCRRCGPRSTAIACLTPSPGITSSPPPHICPTARRSWPLHGIAPRGRQRSARPSGSSGKRCITTSSLTIGLGVPTAGVARFLRTIPPAGQPRLDGAEAVHASVRALAGRRTGWVDYDPTNCCFVATDHIGIGHGRDYGDVALVTGWLRTAGKQSGSHSVDLRALAPGGAVRGVTRQVLRDDGAASGTDGSLASAGPRPLLPAPGGRRPARSDR